MVYIVSVVKYYCWFITRAVLYKEKIMSAKFILFVSLLICLFSISVNVESSNVLDSDSDDELWTLPLKPERHYIIQATLDELGASVGKALMVIMLELTFGYDKMTIKNLVSDMVKESKTDFINQEICLKKLTKAIHKYDKKDRAALKYKRLAEITLDHFWLAQSSKDEPTIIDQSEKEFEEQHDPSFCFSEENDIPEVTLSEKSKKYPLVKNVIHPDRLFFSEIAKQLKAGRFENTFRRGMLFYGPPGVGKTEMVKAIANESNCHLFKIAGSEVVDGYKGSGAASIQNIFAKAKAVDINKGAIVFIDELERLAPRTTAQNTPFAYQYEGQEEGNALTQIWMEYDNCLENHANIFVVTATNKFEVIDKRIRDRFMCVEFSNPDETGAYEILKNKAQYYNVSLSKAELQHHTKRMKGLSGRELTTFIQDVGVNISKGMSREKALKLAAKKQVKAKKDAKSPSKRFEQLMDEALRGAAHGAAGAIASTLVTGILSYFQYRV